MIEVLLAVVVLAIGLLAGSKMQMLGMNYTQGAQMRSTATLAANDIIDRMRLNPAGVAAGAYDNTSTENLPTDPDCLSSGCSPSELADHDLIVWASYFGKGSGANTSTPLYGAVGEIDRITTGGSLAAIGYYNIKVTWTELIEGVEKQRAVEMGVNLN